MSHEAVSIVADFAADPTYGVNALLPLIPHDAGETPPPAITVADENTDGYVARRLIPAGVDLALMVMLASDATFDGTPETRSNTARILGGSVDVLLLYAVRQTTSKTAVRYTKDVLRAVRNCVILLNDPANATRRTRNGVTLGPATAIRQVGSVKREGDALSTAGIVVSYATRESVALITPD